MSEIMLINPRKRRRKKRRTTKKRARKRNPVRRKKATRRRRRRNPVRGGVQGQVMTALTGASGALALDVALGYLPIPANLKAGIVGTAVKAGLAIGIGVLGKNAKLVRPATAAKLADGALTVVLHNELKRQVANFLPAVQLGEYLDAGYNNNGMGYYGSGYNPGPVYLPDISDDGMNIDEGGFGEYINDWDDSSGMYH
jgi:hypothetical protein